MIFLQIYSGIRLELFLLGDLSKVSNYGNGWMLEKHFTDRLGEGALSVGRDER